MPGYIPIMNTGSDTPALNKDKHVPNTDTKYWLLTNTDTMS